MVESYLSSTIIHQITLCLFARLNYHAQDVWRSRVRILLRAPANNPKASRTPPGGFFVPDAKTFVPQAFATLRPSPFASREGPFQTAPAAFSGPTRPNSPMSRIPGLRHAWLFYKHLEKKYFQKHIFAVSGHSPFWLFAVTSAFCAPAPPTANHHRHHTATKSPRSAQSRHRHSQFPARRNAIQPRRKWHLLPQERRTAATIPCGPVRSSASLKPQPPAIRLLHNDPETRASENDLPRGGREM